jgi:hypothetical protein
VEEVKFIRGNDRINRLAQRPDIAAEVARIRADMAEADRTYAMGLAALRQAAELTQVELKVTTMPGEIALAVMPHETTSADSARVKPSTPALDAE